VIDFKAKNLLLHLPPATVAPTIQGMKQPLKSSRSAATRRLTVLDCPACEQCIAPMRFVGLESIAESDQADLCTYECSQCGHVQASMVARRNGAGGEADLRR
jgi:hypothetical protein